MNVLIDWSEWPEATHALTTEEPWDGALMYKGTIQLVKQLDGGSFQSKKGGYPHIGPRSWVVLAKRPTDLENSAVWDGKGLPPVGCECEAYWGRGVYLPIKVLAHDEGVVVFHYKAGPRKGEYAGHSDVEIDGIPAFRPMKTAEQLAAEGREEAIAEMVSRFAINGSAVNWRELFAQMYDAGARMPGKGLKA